MKKIKIGKTGAKTCFKCGEIKLLGQFYKHPKMKDGRLNKCKECAKTDVKENRHANIEHYRAYDRTRGGRTTRGQSRRYRRNNPIAYGAHCVVSNALRAGRLVKPDECETSGCESADRLHGHHDDYAKPLDVRWLCPLCHRHWHDAHGKGLNG